MILNQYLNSCLSIRHSPYADLEGWRISLPALIQKYSINAAQQHNGRVCNMTVVIYHKNSWLASSLSELRKRYIIRKNAAVKSKVMTARYQKSLAKMNSLSNRDLLDIGLSRADIPQIAFEQSQKDSTNEST